MGRTNSKLNRKPARVAGVLALVIGLSFVAAYASGLVSVTSVQASGSVVTVGLVNNGSSAASGSVVVTAIVGGQLVSSSAPFALGVGQSGSVSLGLGGSISGGVTVGVVVDNPHPF